MKQIAAASGMAFHRALETGSDGARLDVIDLAKALAYVVGGIAGRAPPSVHALILGAIAHTLAQGDDAIGGVYE